MILDKYNGEPIELDVDREYVQRVHFKPRGFWLTVDGEDGWHEWCVAEDFHTENLAVRHQVEVSTRANIAWIKNEAELLAFHEEFAVELFEDSITKYPDWAKVAEKYDGFMVSPYDRIFSWYNVELSWYGTFDVASACIWNLSMIERITVIS